MIKYLVEQYGTSNTSDASEQIVKDYINQTCEKILDCTAVFKNDEQGKAAFDKFMTECLGCK